MTDMDFILDYINSIPNVDTSKIFAIGHSSGAQIELIYDNNFSKKPFKKIFSLHTTLENVDLVNARKWSDLSFLLNNNCKLSTTPTLLFAPTSKVLVSDINDTTGLEKIYELEISPKFLPFKQNKTTPYSFVTLKYNLSHDGFISLGNFRFLFDEKHKFKDNAKINLQQFYYECLLGFLKNEIFEDSKVSNKNNINQYFSVEKSNH
jgi:hypothetical protein